MRTNSVSVSVLVQIRAAGARRAIVFLRPPELHTNPEKYCLYENVMGWSKKVTCMCSSRHSFFISQARKDIFKLAFLALLKYTPYAVAGSDLQQHEPTQGVLVFLHSKCKYSSLATSSIAGISSQVRGHKFLHCDRTFNVVQWDLIPIALILTTGAEKERSGKVPKVHAYILPILFIGHNLGSIHASSHVFHRWEIVTRSFRGETVVFVSPVTLVASMHRSWLACASTHHGRLAPQLCWKRAARSQEEGFARRVSPCCSLWRCTMLGYSMDWSAARPDNNGTNACERAAEPNRSILRAQPASHFRTAHFLRIFVGNDLPLAARRPASRSNRVERTEEEHRASATFNNGGR